MIGTRLSHYRILAALGAGGMGRVYRARDERLNRDVALKVLSSGLLSDDRARNRFRNEARVLSRLSHPHIAMLLDSDQADGFDFLVMELVRGPTIAKELQRGALPPKEVARLGSQLSRGLHAAHRQGVIHGDLKPGNLGLTEDGLLKILDFGVARLVEPAPDTTEDTTQTGGGRAAGSPPYMAPEQVLGKSMDERSDIYSAGAVLYELATGCRLFRGAKGSALIASILNETPLPPREISPDLPTALEFVILKAIEKDPSLRYKTAGDLMIDLERVTAQVHVPPRAPRGQLARPFTEADLAPHPRTRSLLPSGFTREPEASDTMAAGAHRTTVDRPRWLLAYLALGAVLIAAGLAVVRSGPLLTPPLRLAPLALVPITSSRGLERDPALSPDGLQLAYVSNEAAATYDLYVKAVGSPTAMRLTTSAASECCPTWSPDQRSVAFLRLLGEEAVIVTMPALGGAEQRRVDVNPWFGSAVSWSPDGRHLAYSARPAAGESFVVMLVSLDSGEVTRLTSPSPTLSGDAFPTFSPDGGHVAFARLSKAGDVTSGEIYLAPVSGGEPRRLTHSSPRFIGDLDWTPDGREVLFFADHTRSVRLSRVALSGGEPALVWPGGDPLPDEDVAETLAEVSHSFRFSTARKTRRLALTQRRYDTNIYRFTISEPGVAAAAPVIGSSRADESPQVSPDGRKIAFSSTRSGRQEIWVCESDGSGCGALTQTPHGGTPRWSPDGGSIAFDAWSEQHKGADIFTIDVDTLTVRRVTTSGADDLVPSWSRDGRSIYFASNRSGGWQVYRAPAGGGEAQQLTREGGFAAFETPEASQIVYTKFDAPGLFQIDRDGGTPRRILDKPRCWGHWTVTPEGIYLLDPNEAGRMSLELLGAGGGAPRHVATFGHRSPCAESSLASSPDGRYLLYVGVEESSDIASVDDYP
jgi:Tol biopolymer transport system component